MDLIFNILVDSLRNSVRNFVLQCRMIHQHFHKNKAITIFDGGHLSVFGKQRLEIQNGRHIEMKMSSLSDFYNQ